MQEQWWCCGTEICAEMTEAEKKRNNDITRRISGITRYYRSTDLREMVDDTAVNG